MSAAVEIVLALLVLFVLAALYLGAAAVVQLARLQAAVMKHRASAGTAADDDQLYSDAGFDSKGGRVPYGYELPPEGEP